MTYNHTLTMNQNLITVALSQINNIKTRTFLLTKTKIKKKPEYLQMLKDEVKEINKFVNKIIDEMNEKSFFTFDDIVNMQHRLNKANREFNEVLKKHL